MEWVFVCTTVIVRFMLSHWRSNINARQFCEIVKQKLLDRPIAVAISCALMLIINNKYMGFSIVVFVILWWHIELLCEKSNCSRTDRALRMVGCGLFGFLITYTNFANHGLLLQILNGTTVGEYASSTVALGFSIIMCTMVEHMNNIFEVRETK